MRRQHSASRARTPSLLLLLLLLLAQTLVHQVEAAVPRVPCLESKFADQYKAILVKISACENVTGITMVNPLVLRQKRQLCEKCPELRTMAQQDGLPFCTVVNEGSVILLRTQFRKFFWTCVSHGSDSGSGSYSNIESSTTTPAPATKSPSATAGAASNSPTTKKPTTSGSDDGDSASTQATSEQGQFVVVAADSNRRQRLSFKLT